MLFPLTVTTFGLMSSLLVKDLELTGLPEGSGPEEPPLVVFLSKLAFKQGYFSTSTRNPKDLSHPL